MAVHWVYFVAASCALPVHSSQRRRTQRRPTSCIECPLPGLVYDDLPFDGLQLWDDLPPGLPSGEDPGPRRAHTAYLSAWQHIRIDSMPSNLARMAVQTSEVGNLAEKSTCDKVSAMRLVMQAIYEKGSPICLDLHLHEVETLLSVGRHAETHTCTLVEVALQRRRGQCKPFVCWQIREIGGAMTLPGVDNRNAECST